MNIKFPNDFMWGTATSGPQTEGAFDKKTLSIMDYWFDKEPNDFHNSIGPNITSSFYYKYKQDVQIMKSLGLKSFRTSIQWTRLIEDISTNKVDDKSVEFYRSYFSELKKSNIKILINLYHFDMPITLQEIGGFENKKVVDLFVGYAKKCFELFGDLVDDWSTFNEPIVPIEAGYLYKFHYPKICDFKRAIQAAYGILLAHAKTVNVFHDLFRSDKNKRISIILNITPTYPKDDNKENVLAAKNRDSLINNFFLDGVAKGVINKEAYELIKSINLLPEYNLNEIEEIKKSHIDFLGVNYYQPSRVEKPLKNQEHLMPEKWYSNYIWEQRRINKYRGWEIYPKALYDISLIIKNKYNNIPWFVSENGMGVEGEERFRNKEGFIDDQYRIDFIKEHLYWLNKGIEEGSNCFGYHVWTFIDCWSWANSYKNRYGLVELDIKTQNRIIKKSGYWFKKMIDNKNVIEIEDDLIKD